MTRSAPPLEDVELARALRAPSIVHSIGGVAIGGAVEGSRGGLFS